MWCWWFSLVFRNSCVGCCVVVWWIFCNVIVIVWNRLFVSIRVVCICLVMVVVWFFFIVVIIVLIIWLMCFVVVNWCVCLVMFCRLRLLIVVLFCNCNWVWVLVKILVNRFRLICCLMKLCRMFLFLISIVVICCWLNVVLLMMWWFVSVFVFVLLLVWKEFVVLSVCWSCICWCLSVNWCVCMIVFVCDYFDYLFVVGFGGGIGFW